MPPIENARSASSNGSIVNKNYFCDREKTLFVNHQSSSKSIMTAKMAVANAVASQWLGNLVSPAGWEFAWINKGLATYLQYFVTAKVMFIHIDDLYDTLLPRHFLYCRRYGPMRRINLIYIRCRITAVKIMSYYNRVNFYRWNQNGDLSTF